MHYYDPRISIFLSVDPLAENNPGWTPYHYVHNNPINLIDPDPTGMSKEDWIIKSRVDREGNKSIQMTFVGAVYNDSGKNINMSDFSNAIRSQF